MKSKQGLQNQISTTTDVSTARRDLQKILKTMKVVSVRMDEEITESNPKQDVDLELHVSEEDVVNSEVEGETNQDKRKQVGRVAATVRQDKAEVTSTMQMKEPAYSGKKNQTKNKASITESVNGKPKGPRKEYTEEEKNTHDSRQVPTPEGWRETWHKAREQWFYSIGEFPNETSVRGDHFSLVKQMCEKNSQDTDTAGKISSGSEASSTEESTAQAIEGIPEEEKENRRADNARTEIEVQKEQVGEKVVERPNIQGESNKEKRMRAKPRSPDRSRDKIGRAKSMTRRGSRDKGKEYKSRSKSQERPRIRSRERAKEENPDKEIAMAKSVSIGMKETNRGTTHRIGQQAEMVPRRLHASRCGRCHTYDGTKTRDTHSGLCYALTMICDYCQKKGHVAKACYDRHNEKRDDQELGSHPCFACENPNHEWKNCPRGEPNDKNPGDWPEGLKNIYYRFKNRFAYCRKENVPDFWKRLMIYYEQEQSGKRNGVKQPQKVTDPIPSGTTTVRATHKAKNNERVKRPQEDKLIVTQGHQKGRYD